MVGCGLDWFAWVALRVLQFGNDYSLVLWVCNLSSWVVIYCVIVFLLGFTWFTCF